MFLDAAQKICKNHRNIHGIIAEKSRNAAK
jgi:hypothetical protein